MIKKNKKTQEIFFRSIMIILILSFFIFLWISVSGIIKLSSNPSITIYENVCENETTFAIPAPIKIIISREDTFSVEVTQKNLVEEKLKETKRFCRINSSYYEECMRDFYSEYYGEDYADVINIEDGTFTINKSFIERFSETKQICTLQEFDEIKIYGKYNISDDWVIPTIKNISKSYLQENPEFLEDNCECVEYPECKKGYIKQYEQDNFCYKFGYDNLGGYYYQKGIELSCSKYKCGNYEVEVQR